MPFALIVCTALSMSKRKVVWRYKEENYCQSFLERNIIPPRWGGLCQSQVIAPPTPTSTRTQEWTEEIIGLFCGGPAVSPDLNPVEHLWKLAPLGETHQPQHNWCSLLKKHGTNYQLRRVYVSREQRNVPLLQMLTVFSSEDMQSSRSWSRPRTRWPGLVQRNKTTQWGNFMFILFFTRLTGCVNIWLVLNFTVS